MPYLIFSYIGWVGAIQTFPSPLNVFKNPSPFIAEPNKLLSDFVTLKFTPLVLAIAKFPSTFNSWPLLISHSTISDFGTLHSSITTPEPVNSIWNNPSPPSNFYEIFFCITPLTVISSEQQ